MTLVGKELIAQIECNLLMVALSSKTNKMRKFFLRFALCDTFFLKRVIKIACQIKLKTKNDDSS